MIYKCLNCGCVFEDGEEGRIVETYEYFGQMCSETTYVCPECKGDFEEAISCEVCGIECTEDELNGGVCEKCINEYRKDFQACYEISKGEKQEVEINGLLATLFDENEIEMILKEHIKDKCPDIDCSEFIDSDISWFGEQLAKEVNK